MEIIFQGRHSEDEARESFYSVLEMLKKHYQINGFREMHLTLTLVDSTGDDVELVDSDTNEPYRVIEVRRDDLQTSKRIGRPALKLVVDNTNTSS